jgi:hypothetical protein
MDALTKKKTDRFRYLNLLYERTGGQRLKFLDMWDLGGELAIGRDDTHALVDYLVGENLAEHRGIGGIIGITHYGIVEVERALTEPEAPTKYFPPVINVLNIHSVVGSQIQQGTHDSTQAQTVTTNDTEAIRALVNGFRERLSDLPFDQADRSEAEAELQTLEAQLRSSKPKSAIVRESLKTLRNLLEGVASNALAAVLLPMFGPLSTLLGS